MFGWLVGFESLYVAFEDSARTSFGVDVPLVLTVWWVGLISRERRQRCISHSTSPLDSRHQNGRDMEGPARDT